MTKIERYQLSYTFLASVAGKLDAMARDIAFSSNCDFGLAGGLLGHARALRVGKVL